MNEIFGLFEKGGIIMYPLLLTSIVALAVVIERALFLRKRRIINPLLVDRIKNIKHVDDAQELLRDMEDKSGPFINIIRAGLEFKNDHVEEIQKSLEDQGRQETRIMEKGLVILETVAGIAPLLGLLGTVLGMIKVFQVISEQGLGQTQALSSGISEALVTTVVGLSIAIPALIAYHYFDHKVEDLVLEIEKYSTLFIRKMQNKK